MSKLTKNTSFFRVMTNLSHLCGTGMFEVGMGAAASFPWHVLLTVTGMRAGTQFGCSSQVLNADSPACIENLLKWEKSPGAVDTIWKITELLYWKENNLYFHFFLFPSSL